MKRNGWKIKTSLDGIFKDGGNIHIKRARKTKVKLKKKHFKLFKKACRKWIKFFGLSGWDVYFDFDNDPDSMGWYESNLTNRAITIGISGEIPDWSFSKKEIEKIAFHEVVEGMLIGRLKELAKKRYTTEEQIEEAVHDIVRTLENTILKNR